MFRPNQNQCSIFLIRAAGRAGLASGTDFARRNTSAKHPYSGKRQSDSTMCGPHGLGRSDAETGDNPHQDERLSLRDRWSARVPLSAHANWRPERRPPLKRNLRKTCYRLSASPVKIISNCRNYIPKTRISIPPPPEQDQT